MAKTPTRRLGENPLAGRKTKDAAPISTPAPAPPADLEEAGDVEEVKEAMDRLNLYVPESLAAYVRDVCYGLGREYTLGDLFADAMPDYLTRLENERNNGEKFPPRPPGKTRLRPGRPIR